MKDDRQRSAPSVYRDLKERARLMRKYPTLAEAILWKCLRHKQVRGCRFRRQHPIANVRFIVDFYCVEKNLVIEIDGAIHYQLGQGEYDENRQQFLEEYGTAGVAVSK